MLDRFEPMLKIICLALGALLLFQVVQRVLHSDPLGHASVPPLPALTVEAKDKDVPTKSAAKEKAAGTNATAHIASAGKDTNGVARMKPPRHGRNFGPQMGGPAAAMNLPPSIQSHVDRIKESEILGPFMRPMPMALLGIADDDVFLRAPNGQTGMVKEGAELGGVKILRIGINRVLVEQDGEKKELTLFDGFGSDSLIPKEKDISNNATNMPDNKENP